MLYVDYDYYICYVNSFDGLGYVFCDIKILIHRIIAKTNMSLLVLQNRTIQTIIKAIIFNT